MRWREGRPDRGIYLNGAPRVHRLEDVDRLIQLGQVRVLALDPAPRQLVAAVTQPPCDRAYALADQESSKGVRRDSLLILLSYGLHRPISLSTHVDSSIMVSITASAATSFDMFETAIASLLTAEYTLASERELTLSFFDGEFRVLLTGDSFELSVEGAPISGTIHSLEEYRGDQLVFQLRDISLSISRVAEWFGKGEYDAFFKEVMRGSDVVIGSNDWDRIFTLDGDDVIHGGAGNDDLDAGLGNDIIDGGSGVDSAVFAAARSEVLISFTEDGQVIVTGPDGRDFLSDIEMLSFRDGDILSSAAEPVGKLYSRFAGRDASGSELAYWTAELNANRCSISDIRATILDNPIGEANTSLVVAGLYREYIGRDAVLSEVSYWHDQVRGGEEFAGIRSILVQDPSGRSHAASRISSTYQEYMGRDAGPSEIAFWISRLQAGDQFADVRNAILDNPAGREHTQAHLADLYDEYMGRDAGPSEIAFWMGALKAGAHFADVRNAILDNVLGQQYIVGKLDEMYGEFFARPAGEGEHAVWSKLFHTGVTLDGARVTLLGHSASADQVHQEAGSSGSDKFTFLSTDRYMSVSRFNPEQDQIDLRALGLGELDLRNVDTAREVSTPEGGTDILITIALDRELHIRDMKLTDVIDGYFLL